MEGTRRPTRLEHHKGKDEKVTTHRGNGSDRGAVFIRKRPEGLTHHNFKKGRSVEHIREEEGPDSHALWYEPNGPYLC